MAGARAGAGQEKEQGWSRVGTEELLGSGRAAAGAGQEQEQGRSVNGAGEGAGQGAVKPTEIVICRFAL